MHRQSELHHFDTDCRNVDCANVAFSAVCRNVQWQHFILARPLWKSTVNVTKACPRHVTFHMTRVLLTSLFTCKLIGVTLGKWESTSALDLYPSLSRGLSFGLHLELFPSLGTSKSSLAAHTAGEKQRPNNWFPVSIPPLPLFFFNPTRSQWLSLPLSSPSIFLCLHLPSILPTLLHFFSAAFPSLSFAPSFFP